MTHDHHAHLRQLSTDPTNTEAIREQFLKDVRQRFKRLRGRIREVVGYDEDRLQLTADSRLSSYDLKVDVPGPALHLEAPDLLMAHRLWGIDEFTALADADDIERFPTDAGKARAFTEWLAERLRDGVLEPVSRKAVRNGEHWTATYIRSAYARGWENARERLQQAGIETAEIDRDIFDLGVPQRQLRRLYTRAYDNLQSITDEGVEPVRETLTQGLAEGWHPRKMARKLTDEVETLQKTRAEVLARTEVINSYADATLDRYERAGQDGVTVSGEFATADDDRVCPICEAIAGTEYAADEMRSATFEFEPSESEPDHLAGDYPVKPPVHPQCRCAIFPVVE